MQSTEASKERKDQLLYLDIGTIRGQKFLIDVGALLPNLALLGVGTRTVFDLRGKQNSPKQCLHRSQFTIVHLASSKIAK